MFLNKKNTKSVEKVAYLYILHKKKKLHVEKKLRISIKNEQNQWQMLHIYIFLNKNNKSTEKMHFCISLKERGLNLVKKLHIYMLLIEKCKCEKFAY